MKDEGAPAPEATTSGAGVTQAVAGRPPSVAPGARVSLFGIGNDLRGDDGAGPRVARALGARVNWDVRVVHGLTPELADDLAACDVALFVDADADPALVRATWRRHPEPVAAGAGAPPLLGHALAVPGLLRLCAGLHGRVPQAATLSLPARDFGLGESLSPVAEEGVAVAVEALLALAGGGARSA